MSYAWGDPAGYAPAPSAWFEPANAVAVEIDETEREAWIERTGIDPNEAAERPEQVIRRLQAENARMRAVVAAAEDWSMSAAKRLDYLSPTERELYRVIVKDGA